MVGNGKKTDKFDRIVKRMISFNKDNLLSNVNARSRTGKSTNGVNIGNIICYQEINKKTKFTVFN